MSEHYEVEAILDHQFDKQQRQWFLLISWEGFSEPSLEPLQNMIDDIPTMVESYIT